MQIHIMLALMQYVLLLAKIRIKDFYNSVTIPLLVTKELWLCICV